MGWLERKKSEHVTRTAVLFTHSFRRTANGEMERVHDWTGACIEFIFPFSFLSAFFWAWNSFELVIMDGGMGVWWWGDGREPCIYERHGLAIRWWWWNTICAMVCPLQSITFHLHTCSTSLVWLVHHVTTEVQFRKWKFNLGYPAGGIKQEVALDPKWWCEGRKGRE
jgi:hypothetical protein